MAGSISSIIRKHNPGDKSNLIAVLQDVQKNPVTKDSKTVAPVVWECNCLEEVCGSCTMVINGGVRQSWARTPATTTSMESH